MAQKSDEVRCCDAGGGAGAVVGPGPVLFVEVALDALPDFVNAPPKLKMVF